MNSIPVSFAGFLLLFLSACSGSFTDAVLGGNKSQEIAGQGVTDLSIDSCTTYIQKFVTCVSEKVPEETKVLLLAALEQSKAQWKQALSSGMAPNVVSESCLAAFDTAKQTLAQYECNW